MAQVTERAVRCSFCRKPASDVAKVVAGPGSVYICDECISLCGEIMVEELGGGAGVQTHDLRRLLEEAADNLDQSAPELSARLRTAAHAL